MKEIYQNSAEGSKVKFSRLRASLELRKGGALKDVLEFIHNVKT